jgi:DNA invertase Pin-like site-specific DNA recombinase
VLRYPESYGVLDRMIRNDEFDVLVCRDADRLGRGVLAAEVLAMCYSRGIAVVSRKEPPASLERIDENHWLTSALSGYFSGREVREIRRRRLEGWAGRAQRGLFVAGCPYGYETVRDERGDITGHAIVPEQAATVRLVLVDLYLNHGWGGSRIADELNSRGIPAPAGGQWGNHSVHEIIKRKSVYAGNVVTNLQSRQGNPVKVYAGKHPAIITADELAAIEAEHERRIPGGRYRSPLAGIVICAHCGRYMSSMYSPKKSRRGGIIKRYYLRCHSGKSVPNPCPHPRSIREEKLIDAIEGALLALRDYDDLSELVDTSVDEEAQAIEAARLQVQSRLRQLAAMRDRIQDAYYSGITNKDDFAARMEQNARQQGQAEAEADNLDNQLIRLSERGQQEERLESLKDEGLNRFAKLYEEPELTRQWLRNHLQVYVRDGEVERIQYM